MPTSSIETRQIEAFLSNTQAPEEHLLFEAKLLLKPDLVDKLNWQKKLTVCCNYTAGKN